MGKTLIIVESPAKTKTLKNFLGKDYMVEASMGHVRDLPQKELGVDIENDFTPKYVRISDRKDVIKKIAEAAKKADSVLLASDPDREGEAISWHLAQALQIKNAKRIEFNEITRSAVENAIQHPREIDMKRVNAQEARRILDRLVGYRLSPLLWKKVRKNLSAGRVQSVAVRLICDREREIQAFIPEEYWSLTATLTPQPPIPKFAFDAKFVGKNGKKQAINNEAEAQALLTELRNVPWAVKSVKKQERKRNPSPPFITSTLQQEASRKLGFGNRRTMSIAQQLYEGVDLGSQGAVGLITYMRTDSTRVAKEAQEETRTFITDQYGEPYRPATPPIYKARSQAQDAHEAIRPTSIYRTPDMLADFLNADQLKMYRLIWQRFLASQMTPAIFDVTTADIVCGEYLFRATGSVLRFTGFMAVYTEGKDTEEMADEERTPLPELIIDQILDLLNLEPKQHFTEPSPRYTEATIVKALEEKGIGRPSTYASIISTIVEREYVVLDQKRFIPTELGFTVNDLLVKHFPNILDVGFTAEMETKLDDIEEGNREKVQLLKDFYFPFNETLSEAHEKMERVKPESVLTDTPCPNCGKPMAIRESRMGKFLGCSGYPRCKTILNLDGTPREAPQKEEPKVTDQKCPKCGKPLVERMGRFGKFLGCSGYPKCRTIVKIQGEETEQRPAQVVVEGVKCPKDGGHILEKHSRRGTIFYGCSNYPKCDFATSLKPIPQICPECGWVLGEGKQRGKSDIVVKCTNPDCSFIMNQQDEG